MLCAVRAEANRQNDRRWWAKLFSYIYIYIFLLPRIQTTRLWDCYVSTTTPLSEWTSICARNNLWSCLLNFKEKKNLKFFWPCRIESVTFFFLSFSLCLQITSKYNIDKTMTFQRQFNVIIMKRPILSRPISIGRM